MPASSWYRYCGLVIGLPAIVTSVQPRECTRIIGCRLLSTVLSRFNRGRLMGRRSQYPQMNSSGESF
jgi:hypothetical protein